MVTTLFQKKLLKRDYISLTLSQLVWKSVFQYWYIYGTAIFCLFITHWAQSLLPFLAKDLGDLAQKGDLEKAPLTYYLLLAVLILIFRTLSRWTFFYPARLIQKEIRLELLQTLESVSPSRYRHYNPGQLYQILQNDLDQIRAYMGFVLLQVVNIIVAIAVLLPKLGNFHLQLLWAFTPLFGSVALFIFILTRFQHYHKRILDRQGEVNNLLIESYYGKPTIKNYHAEKSFLSLFKRATTEELNNFYQAGLGSAFGVPLLTLGVGLSFIWGAYIVQMNNLGASSLILFSGFIFLFRDPLSFLSWIGVVIYQAKAAHKRLLDLVDDVVVPSPWELQLKDCPCSVISDYFYLEIPFWDRSLVWSIGQQRITVIVGLTGHGKSTILRSIAELFQQQGQSCSLVEQVPYLFHDTVEKNLFLGRTPNFTERKIALFYMKLFMLDTLAPTEEDLWKLEVGEMGKRLSGGQAKRLSLVRSLLSQADIILWDDPFSSVDMAQEHMIMSEIKNHPPLKEKTFIFSSHRLSTVKMCDEIVLIDKNDGIVERGETKRLLEQASLTREYFQKQTT